MTTVHIRSFSYRLCAPGIGGPHGGGFVMDCRCLPNPGLEQTYRELTGTDLEVIEYFEREPVVEQFLRSVLGVIDIALVRYDALGFDDVTVAFGCTGGRHRSVYCAERLRRTLVERGYGVTLRHLALESPKT